MKRAVVGFGVLVMLAGCVGTPERLPAQKVGELRVSVSTQPWPPRVGMNEFLVYVDRKKRGFFENLIVYVRTDSSRWEQAIPDGALGVFRRALPVGDPKRETLYVRLRWFGEKKPFAELRFALKDAFAGEGR